MRYIIFSLLVIQSLHAQVKVEKWQPHDFEFKSLAETSNLFTIFFSANVTGPGGTILSLPGFYNGNKTWKVRFSPTKQGTWTIKTHSDESSLNNKQTQFMCIKNTNVNIHGSLMVDAKNPHHFIYDDGTHWFPNGYEANWLWALDSNDNKLPAINAFLDKLSGYGFNFVLMNAYAYDTKWRAGKTEADDYGPSTLYPWYGNNQSPDFTHFNLAYWKHYDAVIEALYKHNIVAHIYFKVYNKEVNWMKNGAAEDDMYYKWIVARYAAYPNIIWDLAKEANYEKSTAYKVDRLKLIRANDPYHRLLTVHTDIDTYDKGAYNGVVDFRSHQEQSDHLHETTRRQLAQNLWPVMNVESGYEYGPKGLNDKTYSHVHSPKDVAKFYWQIQMAGGYNAYYYTYTAWDVVRTKDTPPGYAYIKIFNDFFSKTKYWLLQPADSLVSKGYCLASEGKEYVVYLDKAGTFELHLSGITKSLNAKWFQPLSGKYINAEKLNNGKLSLTSPAEFKENPVVLYLSE